MHPEIIKIANNSEIVGQRKNSKSWDKAISDGWVEGKDLFEIEARVKTTKENLQGQCRPLII